MTKSTCSIDPLSDSTLGTGEGIDAFTFCVFYRTYYKMYI